MELTKRERIAFMAIFSRLQSAKALFPEYIGEFRSAADLPRNIEYPLFYCWNSDEGVVLSTNDPLLESVARREALRGGVILTATSMVAVLSEIKQMVATVFTETVTGKINQGGVAWRT